ncbi:MAG TPA: hypothetical protein VFC93_18070 [Chloroflexota bacterium]|nr:hypothetical protein [Chloroflexota bacterium]
MSPSAHPPPPRPPRPGDDLDAFVTWCVGTPDVLAFHAALRWIDGEHWPAIRERVAAALGAAEIADQRPAGLAAERDARGRAAARRHKLALLARHGPSFNPPRTGKTRAVG